MFKLHYINLKALFIKKAKQVWEQTVFTESKGDNTT